MSSIHKNNCSTCNVSLKGHYVSPSAGVKHCLDCYAGKKTKTLSWWLAFILVELFVVSVVASVLSIILYVFS